MKRSYLVLHLAVILAGFTGIFGKLISLNEGLLVWYRVFFSFIWLFFILKLFKENTNHSFREKFDIGKVGMLITIHWVFFYGSIKYSNISVGVVCYSLTSFFTAIFEPLINRKKFVASELLLSLLTLFGIALIFHFDTSYQVGIILGVISSAFAALYTIYNEKLVQHYDSKVIKLLPDDRRDGRIRGFDAFISLLFPGCNINPGYKRYYVPAAVVFVLYGRLIRYVCRDAKENTCIYSKS